MFFDKYQNDLTLWWVSAGEPVSLSLSLSLLIGRCASIVLHADVYTLDMVV